jgi:hypothetical protein
MSPGDWVVGVDHPGELDGCVGVILREQADGWILTKFKSGCMSVKLNKPIERGEWPPGSWLVKPSKLRLATPEEVAVAQVTQVGGL